MSAQREAIRVVLVTLDDHARPAFERTRDRLRRALPHVEVQMHVAADWDDPVRLNACTRALDEASLVIVTQLFLEDHVRAVLPALDANRDRYDALVCLLSAPEVMRRTKMGRFTISGSAGAGRFSPARLLRRLRGKGKPGEASGKRQLAALKSVPKLLRYVPGTAQDVRAYLLSMRYWLAGSAENLEGLFRYLMDRYVPDVGVAFAPPQDYPEVGLYHPDLDGLGITEDASLLHERPGDRGTVGLLLMRSHILGRNTAHYDAVIRALETRGLRTLPVFASALDASPAVDAFLLDEQGTARVDALVSLTGFSLVGGPAYHDGARAAEVLEQLDVPYHCLQPLEFQSVEAWRADPRGLNALQAALMVAIPELDGATAPLVFGGRAESSEGSAHPIPDRVERAAGRVAQAVRLRRTPRSERRVGVVLFNFPPNAGSVGTAAYLDVFASLYRTLQRLNAEGYTVDVPASVDALREAILLGNADMLGTPANVHTRVTLDEHVASTPWLDEIEKAWGSAPGTALTNGRDLYVLGQRFGNVFVGVQPPFGYEGDPMRLLFEEGFAPTHAFSAFYQWLRNNFDAHAVLHFGTHGALEFMPGKQVGLSADCWPDRLIGDLPNYNVYASNNPSEGTLAKRRGSATLVSHRTPTVLRSGLYRGLADLRTTLDRFLALEPGQDGGSLQATLADQAVAVDLWEDADGIPDLSAAQRLKRTLIELEQSLIPQGLHVLGTAPGAEEEEEILLAAGMVRGVDDSPAWEQLLRLDGDANDAEERVEALARATVQALIAEGPDHATLALQGQCPDHFANAAEALVQRLDQIRQALHGNEELSAIVRALDGRFVPAGPGGDLLRRPEVLPTGRNLYAFDPYRVPDAAAMREGQAQAERLIARYRADHGAIPSSVAMVLWGSDNMKRSAAPVAQVLALLGAEPRYDAYGRLCGARLIPLEDLGRARVDVVVTTSGVFRDLLPVQVRLLAEAAHLAASADEPADLNPVRVHTRAMQDELGVPEDVAALRVFSNAEGAYGANVNLTIDDGTWEDEAALGDTWVRRKGFAYGADGRATAQHELLQRALGRVDCAYQNLDSIELGVSDVDQYVDSLGGLARAVENGGGQADVFIGDETQGAGVVRALDEQIALESRTRMLNPRWYEAMLAHGHQGVKEIEARVTATMGWSATTQQVEGWVYEGIGQTYVLDSAMRERMSALNPTAAARLAQRVLEATDRGYWSPDPETLAALEDATADLEDRLEGIVQPEAVA